MTEEGYYSDLSRAFDKIADSYDGEIGQNAIFRLMRKTNLKFLKETIRPGDNVLEIGCGTGDEAIELAKSGVNVVATDISGNMLRVTEKKARGQGIKNLEIFNLSANNLGFLEKVYGKYYLDGAYSSFGAFNCEPDLRIVDKQLTELIKPDGYFICSIMNKYALNEILPNLVLFRFDNAFQRLNSPRLVPIAKNLRVKAYYYTSKEFSKFFRNFKIEKTIGISLFVPPPYTADFMQNKKGLLEFLYSLDKQTSRLWPFNKLGDHILLKLRKIER